MAEVEDKIFAQLQRVHIDTDNIKRVFEEDHITKLESKIRCKDYPKWDIARNTPEARLIREQRNLISAQEHYTNKLEELTLKRKELDKKKKELEDKQKGLYDSFIKFDTFVRDNRDIQIRSKLQTAKEIERQKQLESKIEDLEKQVENYKQLQDKIAENVDNYSIYVDFLERVVTETSTFLTVQDIFEFYETLTEATKVLTENLDSKLQTIKTIEIDKHQMIETKSRELIDLNKKLSKLQEEYDTRKARVYDWETKVLNLKQETAERKLDLIRIRASAWNMFEQICKSKSGTKMEPGDENNIHKQFENIIDAIIEKKQVLKMVKKRTKTPINL